MNRQERVEAAVGESVDEALIVRTSIVGWNYLSAPRTKFAPRRLPGYSCNARARLDGAWKWGLLPAKA